MNATLTATCAAGTVIAFAAFASVKPLGRVTRANAKKISQSANPLTRQVGICFNLMFVSQWKLISLFSCHLIITSILWNIFPYKSLQCNLKALQTPTKLKSAPTRELLFVIGILRPSEGP